MKVTLSDLLKAVSEGAATIAEVMEKTGAGRGKWCIVANPAGICCREYLSEALSPTETGENSRAPPMPAGNRG